MKVQNTRGKKKKAIIKILNTENETFRKKYADNYEKNTKHYKK